MPKLPLLSGAEIVKVLERLGFEQRRQRGSHVTLRRFDQVCVVPMHREVQVGTLSGLLRQAEVSPDAFMDALRKER